MVKEIFCIDHFALHHGNYDMVLPELYINQNQMHSNLTDLPDTNYLSSIPCETRIFPTLLIY